MRKSNFIQVIVFLLITNTYVGAQEAYISDVTKAATELYQSFNRTQKISGLLRFDDTARMKWNNLPVGLRARAGTSIGNMNDEQRRLMHRVLFASLSSQGYLKSVSIFHLDNLLNTFYDSLYARKEFDDKRYQFIRDLKWSHKNYFFAFFGKPGDDRWGFKLEGHHLSLNFSYVQGILSVTPFFIGTDPAEYPESEYAGWRVLGKEEDLGLKLIRLLTPAQQRKATKSTEVPSDIITAAESGRRLVDDWGLPSSEMNETQKNVMLGIIREFVFNMDHEKALMEYDKILKAGSDKIWFGWIGTYKEEDPHYYVLNGPTFLIEFDNNGGPRNRSGHIHAIWREKGNEYGEDILKKHYLKEKH